MRAAPGRPTAIAQPSADRSAGGLDPSPGRGDPAARLGQQPRLGRKGAVGRHRGGVGAQPRQRSSLASVARDSSASLQASTAVGPQRVVSFMSVVGCGTWASSRIRQNRRQLMELTTSRHRLVASR
jgi:hypothetical protein